MPASSPTNKKQSTRRQRLPPGTPNPVDIHVGGRLRLQRTLVGLSQGTLGDEVGLTFQQIQKYERGANRIGASRLFEFSRILSVPVSFFFDGISDDLDSADVRFERGMQYKKEGLPTQDTMAKRETLELVRAYYGIEDPKVRDSIYQLVLRLGKDQS